MRRLRYYAAGLVVGLLLGYAGMAASAGDPWWGFDTLKRFLAGDHTWTGRQTFTGSVAMGPTGQTKISETGVTVPSRNTPTSPAIAFGDGDSGLLESSDDTLNIVINGARYWEIRSDYYLQSALSSFGGSLFAGGASATLPALTFRDDLDTGIGHADADQLSLIAGGVEGMRITEASSKTVVGIGTSSVSNGHKTLEFGTGTTPTSTPSPGFCALVVSGVTQMFAYGTDGTFSQLSSHDPETGLKWTNEFNIYTGLGERVYKDGTVKTYTVHKINPEISYKEAWVREYVQKNTISVPSVDGGAPTVIVPTLEEAQTAAETGYKFEWSKMPPYVRSAWNITLQEAAK